MATVSSVRAYWADTFTAAGDRYQAAPTVIFTQQVDTACDSATSAVGPLYCPSDTTVYLDLGFYGALRTDFGAARGNFAETYVIAHEYGHHVQHLHGFDRLVGRDTQGAQNASVRLEVQADCLAGTWAADAEATGFIYPLTVDDIAQGLDAAAVSSRRSIGTPSGARLSFGQCAWGARLQSQRNSSINFTAHLDRVEATKTVGAVTDRVRHLTPQTGIQRARLSQTEHASYLAPASSKWWNHSCEPGVQAVAAGRMSMLMMWLPWGAMRATRRVPRGDRLESWVLFPRRAVWVLRVKRLGSEAACNQSSLGSRAADRSSCGPSDAHRAC